MKNITLMYNKIEHKPIITYHIMSMTSINMTNV